MRHWLLESTTKREGFAHAHAFLYALFVTLLGYLEGSDSKDNLPSTFRLFMTTGQTFSYQGHRRRQFYDQVLTLAKEVLVFTLVEEVLLL